MLFAPMVGLFVLYVHRVYLLFITGKRQKHVESDMKSAKSLVALPFFFVCWIFWNIWNASLFWRGGWGGKCSWFGNYNGFRNTSCSSSTSSSRFYRCFSILVILVINSRGLGFYFNFVVGGRTNRASLRRDC